MPIDDLRQTPDIPTHTMLQAQSTNHIRDYFRHGIIRSEVGCSKPPMHVNQQFTFIIASKLGHTFIPIAHGCIETISRANGHAYTDKCSTSHVEVKEASFSVDINNDSSFFMNPNTYFGFTFSLRNSIANTARPENQIEWVACANQPSAFMEWYTSRLRKRNDSKQISPLSHLPYLLPKRAR